MRVDSLYLESFKNLKNFTVSFAGDSSRTVLVGRNGVGKSNLLEALTRIFRDLDLRKPPEFGFTIKYRCGKHLVEIESKRQQHAAFELTFAVAELGPHAQGAQSVPISRAAFYKMNEQTRLLPRHVFGYYSGVSNRMRDLFTSHEQTYRDALIENREDTIRPLFLANNQHSQFVLLAFYSKDDPHIQKFLAEQLSIVGLESVLFVLHEPYWRKVRPTAAGKRGGDPRFWWAKGTVKEFLSDLYRVSLAPLAWKKRVPIGIRRFKTKEHRYCYIQEQADLARLAEGIDQKEFFKRLESTLLSDLLSEVRIRFKVAGQAEALTFQELSEGEQQLLTVLGLLRFTSQDDALFLLDEPDTHLNPAWCLDYLAILRDHGGGLQNSHILMTTHSPLVFAGLKKEEVVVLQQQENPHRIEAVHPVSDPQGMGFSAILTSEFFGLRSSVDADTLALLDEKRELGLKESRTVDEERRLAELNNYLRGLDFTHTVRDPLYREFVEAMSEHKDPDLWVPVLSVDARKRRKAIASEVVRRIKDQGRQA